MTTANRTTRTSSRRRGGIRWHLFQGQLVAVVPLGLLAALLLYLHWQAQEHERERSQIESVRLLAAAVDNALDSSAERLSILARLWASDAVDDRVLYAQTKEALAANADWSNILAFRADGTGVFRADEPFGMPVPPNERLAMWRPVLAERRPVVSDLFAAQRGLVVSVGVPVIESGVVTHFLVADLELHWYDKLLTRQGLPQGAVAALFDRNFKFVARSVEGEERRGQDPTRALVEDMQRGATEGLERYTNLNGTAVYTAWTFTRHGWGVGFATPSAPVANAFWMHLAVFGALWVVALLGGLAYAFAKARPIAASLESLEERADDLASGQRLTDLPGSGVEEVDRAVDALERASEALQSAMRERDRSLETERAARASSEAANRAKDEFLAMLGHELRNPLAAISNAVAIVKSAQRTSQQLDFAAGVIERQSETLKRLIDDLLDVGRAMTDKIVLTRTPLDLAACVRHVVGSLDAAGRLANRHLEIDAEPVWIGGDRLRIEQIVTNLLTNAARFTTGGGRITIRVAHEADDAVLEVADDGCGIAAEDLPRVFDLFFQGASSAERSSGGLGVGLTLVQRLARLHGGGAEAASAGRGRGATFTVRLPAAHAGQGRAPMAPSVEARESLTILLVEDNADARESLRMALELQGHEVLEAGDAQAALELLRRRRPEVAVLDIGLPGMDGYELARRLRTQFGRDLVLIALTGYGTASDERKALEAGFDRHLTKPIDVRDLARVLEQTHRRSSQSGSPVARLVAATGTALAAPGLRSTNGGTGTMTEAKKPKTKRDKSLTEHPIESGHRRPSEGGVGLDNSTPPVDPDHSPTSKTPA